MDNISFTFFYGKKLDFCVGLRSEMVSILQNEGIGELSEEVSDCLKSS